MNFLLDTDICSAHMRRPAKLAHRFIQYTDQLAISSVTLAELFAGAYKHSQVNRLLTLITDLLQEVRVIDFDSECA
ncbi:MAG: type II toxin-antitoxin system VapC family toxin, partial [Planctomycetota bacterium]